MSKFLDASKVVGDAICGNTAAVRAFNDLMDEILLGFKRQELQSRRAVNEVAFQNIGLQITERVGRK